MGDERRELKDKDDETHAARVELEIEKADGRRPKTVDSRDKIMLIEKAICDF